MPTTKINIQTGYDGTGSGAAQVALGKVGATATKAERELLAYAQTVARAQRAQGDFAGSATTIQSALDQVTRSTKQAVAAESQLAITHNRLNGTSLPLTQLFSNLGSQLSGMGGSAGQAAGALGQLAGSFGTLGVVGAALGVGKVVVDLSQAGAQADQVALRFNGLAKAAGTTGDALLGALRKASGGEITDLNLQLAANKANLLGVAKSAEEFGTLMAIARDRAQSLGISTTQAFNDLVTGLGRGSALILDNLGIIVDANEVNKAYADSIGKVVTQLTEAEKKQALISAVIKQGNVTLAETGGAADTSATKMARVGIAFENAKQGVGSFLAGGIIPLIDRFEETSSAASALIGWLGQLGSSTDVATAGMDAYRNAIQHGATAAQAQIAAEQARAAALAASATASATDASATNALTGSMSAESAAAAQLATAQATATAGLIEDITQKQTATAEAQKLAAVQATLASLGSAVAGGFQTAASAATLLATRYGFAYGEALKLVNAQAALANKPAQTDLQKGLSALRSGSVITGNEISDANTRRMQKASADAKAASDKAAKDAAALSDVQFDNQLKKAKSNAAKIALLRGRAASADPIERARIEGQIIDLQSQKVAGLSKEANIQESIYDSINKQRQAKLDLVGLSIDNQRATTKEAAEAARLQAALDSGRQSAPRQDAIRLRLAEIQNDQAQRALKIEEAQASAGGSIVNGKLLQSQPGAVPTALGPPTSVGGAPFAPAGASAAPFNPAVAAPPVVVNIALNIADGKLTSASAGGGVLNVMLGSAQQTFASGG